MPDSNYASPFQSHAATEALAILRLAGPMVVAQLAQTGIAFVDTLMAGRLSAADLAAVSLGSSIWLTVFLSLSGILMALAPLVSQAFGAGRNIELIDGVRLQRMMQHVESPSALAGPPTEAKPACPKCQSEMVLRTAQKGANAGKTFWGCSTYPQCNGTRPAN